MHSVSHFDTVCPPSSVAFDAIGGSECERENFQSTNVCNNAPGERMQRNNDMNFLIPFTQTTRNPMRTAIHRSEWMKYDSYVRRWGECAKTKPKRNCILWRVRTHTRRLSLTKQNVRDVCLVVRRARLINCIASKTSAACKSLHSQSFFFLLRDRWLCRDGIQSAFVQL